MTQMGTWWHPWDLVALCVHWRVKRKGGPRCGHLDASSASLGTIKDLPTPFSMTKIRVKWITTHLVKYVFLMFFNGFIRERPYWTHTRDHAFYLVKSLQSPLKQWRIPQESPPFFRPDPSTPPRDGARREAGAFQVGIRWDLMVI